MYSQIEALNLLESYSPVNEEEKKAHDFIKAFVAEHQQYWSRETLRGHLTASAWVTDIQRSQAVLLHHKKLNIWVQPGGHIDADDETLIAASIREATEETGLTHLRMVSPEIFDVDVHSIPERKGTPEHLHLDIRFWFEVDNMDLQISDESNELKWLTRSEIESKTNEESVLRMVRKSLI